MNFHCVVSSVIDKNRFRKLSCACDALLRQKSSDRLCIFLLGSSDLTIVSKTRPAYQHKLFYVLYMNSFCEICLLFPVAQLDWLIKTLSRVQDLQLRAWFSCACVNVAVGWSKWEVDILAALSDLHTDYGESGESGLGGRSVNVVPLPGCRSGSVVSWRRRSALPARIRST